MSVPKPVGEEFEEVDEAEEVVDTEGVAGSAAALEEEVSGWSRVDASAARAAVVTPFGTARSG